MRLSEVVKGATYMIANPCKRIVTVEDTGTWEKMIKGGVETQGAPRLEELPCVTVRATIPAVEIEGFVSRKAAARGANMRQALAGLDEDTDVDWRCWKEVWCERRVGTLVRVRGGTAMKVSEDPAQQVHQVYCEAITSLDGRVGTGPSPEIEDCPLRSSGLVGQSVEPLSRVAQTKLSADPFALPADEEAA